MRGRRLKSGLSRMPGYRAPALRRAALTVAMLAGFAGPESADPVADFYRGRTIEIDVGTGVGGGYDANARLVARHLERLLPGNPTVIVNNLPGGGGIRAANTLFNKSVRDGSVLGTFSNAMITEPMLGSGQALFDPAKLTWIGSASREDGLCLATPSSGVTSWGDLLRKDVIVGTAAPGTTTYMYPVVLRNLFGARFKLVSGYPDGGQIALAIERNEVQAVCQTYSSLAIGHPAWLRDRVVQPLIGLGLGRIADLPDLPSVMELATTDEQRQVLKVVLALTLAEAPVRRTARYSGRPRHRVAPGVRRHDQGPGLSGGGAPAAHGCCARDRQRDRSPGEGDLRVAEGRDRDHQTGRHQ